MRFINKHFLFGLGAGIALTAVIVRIKGLYWQNREKKDESASNYAALHFFTNPGLPEVGGASCAGLREYVKCLALTDARGRDAHAQSFNSVGERDVPRHAGAVRLRSVLDPVPAHRLPVRKSCSDIVHPPFKRTCS